MFSETYIEKRPLKKPKLGPADVYPQEIKQREDELTSMNVKHGFATMPQLSEEFGTARNCNVTASKVGAYFNGILAKKEELMTLTDSGRKKQHVKDNFWPVTQRTKQILDNWFKDLAGNKPLSSLAKKAPSFNKKEEIFAMLCENQVTMQRAAWFIKLSSAYTVAVSEAKIKKRQMPDPATEWTGTMIKFLKDLISKLIEYYHTGPPLEKPSVAISSGSSNVISNTGSTGSSSLTIPPPLASPASTTSSLLPVPATPQEEQKLALKQWNYCTQLCKYMFEEGLLDKHEFLNWILDLFDKLRSQPTEDGILKLYLPLALSYMQDFVQSERLSRKLAYLASKKLSSMLNEMVNHLNLDVNGKNNQSASKTSNTNNETAQKSQSPYERAFDEYLNCPQHRDTIIQLSCILQVITLDCPTALVWSGIGENRPSVLSGSPLDHLPIAPSTLPMPEKSPKSNIEYRIKLKFAEDNIKARSQQAESRWCTDKWRATTGNSTVKLLNILDTLDSYFFDRMDNNNSLDTLYAKIFPSLPDTLKDGKDNKLEYDINTDEETVKILCEWAVSTHRWGEHRAMAVARLLDKRQSEILMNENDANNNDDKDSDIGSGATPIFQTILLRFLDTAPVLEENANAQNKAQFKNLVHLFSELIRNDVFSHDAYMCTLISRGDLLNAPSFIINMNNKTLTSNTDGGLDDELFSDIGFKPTKMEEFDDSNVDDDLEKLIQNIKDGQQNSMDAPDSPKDNEHLTNLPSLSNDKNSSSTAASCRHYIYTLHFPLSQDDASLHDCNQRYILLYSVGKERDERKHSVKKMSKEICKLFSKKFSIDVAEGGKVKKHSRSEFNFESTLTKCQSMCYFDQHYVTWQCAVTVQEMLNSFAMGNSNYLPVAEHVAFLFDLMEVALNIYGVIDMCIQILKELPDVEAQLMAKNSNLIKSYTTTLSLYVVGILRRYNSCLLLCPDQTTSVFEGLCKVVKHVSNPSDCSSAERCILAYLYDLYLACSILKTKPPSEPFHNAYPKIKQTICAPIKLTPIPQPYNPQYMSDIIANPKRGGKIEPTWGRQLSESQMNRYSFVCNAIIAVIRETDNDKLNDIAIMCAELTACCNSLSAEWLGALSSLCSTKNESGYYMEILNAVDLQNYHIYNSIAVFTCILVARHCFALVDFVAIVALPALLTYYRMETIMNEVEASARLTCHILLRLFQAIEYPQPGMYSVSTSPIPVNGPININIKLSCDRLLLGGAHKNISKNSVAPVLAVLKAILVVADATVHKTSYGSGKKSGLNTPVHPGSTPKSMSGPVDLSHILGTREDMGMLGDSDDPMGLDLGIDIDSMSGRSIFHNRNSNNMANSENSPSLSEFAQHVLKQICTQEWVLECCLKNCDEMCKDEILLDSMLTNKQAQRLLHMICYDQEANSKIEANMDQKAHIVRILENLEQWSLRISLLDLQLMYKQTQSNSSEFSSWLDAVARAAIDVFIPNDERNVGKNKPPIWLVAPLVAKLPSEVQGRILKVAGQVLESTNSFGVKNKSSENNENNGTTGRKRSVQIDHQPFLSLVLTCLKGQDDQKEGLLQSLHSQLSQFLQNKELEFVGGIDDPTGREEMLDALQLRFSLVGGLFDSIQRNSTSTTDWALLLTQLMSQSVIDLNNNSELFNTVLDMLATLIHSTLVSDSQSERDENKKLYTNLMKKLRKELAEKNSQTIRLVRQLLPLAKPACSNTCEVIATEAVGSGMDSKGLRVTEKERVSMWDLLEGHKNPAPLLWSWFGAVKMERKPLAYEESHRLLKYHTHSLVKPSSYFYEPLQLPPEDAEDNSQDKTRDDKADTPSSVESPAGGAPGTKRKGTKRPRKPKASTTPNQTTPNPAQMQNQGINPMMQQQHNPQQQMMNQQMGQQFQNQQPMNNMMQNNMMMNQMGMQMAPNTMQMNQMGMNNMQQNNPNMSQMNPMPYQQNQQQHQMNNMNQMGQMNMNQQNMNMNMNMNQMGQQQNQQWSGYNTGMQQQQPQQQQQQQQQQAPSQTGQGNQQFYNQGITGMPSGPQMNQFDRPQLNQSKQALSNMLRQRQPNQNPQFNMQQQRMPIIQNPSQTPQQLQQLQQRQMMYRARMGGKPMNAAGMMSQQTASGNAMGGMAQQTPANMMPNAQQGMMSGGSQNQGMVNQPNPSVMGMNQQTPAAMPQQQQQNTIMPGPSSGGMMQQNPVVPNIIQQQQQQQPNPQMAGNNMNQQQQHMMQQNVGNQMSGMQNQMQQGTTANQQQQQGGMFPNQYQNMNQNYAGYNNPAMGANQPGVQGQQQQGNIMGNFQQNPAAGNQQRNPQAEFLAQQQRVRAQYIQQQQQQTPNVTMNTNMGNLPPYRQGGKPMVNPNAQQQMLMRQQMMMKQQQQQNQGMGQQANNPNMGQGMGMGPNQSGLQQQTPALVAQLQRQIPNPNQMNQMNPNMMGQQQQQQQNFNQGPF